MTCWEGTVAPSGSTAISHADAHDRAGKSGRARCFPEIAGGECLSPRPREGDRAVPSVVPALFLSPPAGAPRELHGTGKPHVAVRPLASCKRR